MNRYHVSSYLYLEALRHSTKAKQFSGSFPQDIAELFQKPLPVLVVFENLSAFDTADNDLMHRPRRIDAGFALHEYQIQQIDIYVNLSRTSPSPHHTLPVKNFVVKMGPGRLTSQQRSMSLAPSPLKAPTGLTG